MEQITIADYFNYPTVSDVFLERLTSSDKIEGRFRITDDGMCKHYHPGSVVRYLEAEVVPVPDSPSAIEMFVVIEKMAKDNCSDHGHLGCVSCIEKFMKSFYKLNTETVIHIRTAILVDELAEGERGTAFSVIMAKLNKD